MTTTWLKLRESKKRSERRLSLRVVIPVAALSALLGAVATAFYFRGTQSTAQELISQVEVNEKVEIAGDAEVSDTLLTPDSASFEGCNASEELKAVNARRACSQSAVKAGKFWTKMATAEDEALKMLQAGDRSGSEFVSCDAYDLTWYEIHCESDRIQITWDVFAAFLSFLKAKPSLLKNAKWVRMKPNQTRLRNPGWVLRSRLVSPDFRLGEPWASEDHPTESGTVVLLEQKLDGRIYIAGLPLTGVEFEGVERTEG